MSYLVQFFSRWPLSWLHRVGVALGWLVYWASPEYRGRLRENTARAGVSVRARRQAVAEAGKMVMELPSLWLRPAGVTLGDKARWEGLELIEAALAEGKGLVLLTPHLGAFEVCAQACAEAFGARHPLTVLYRPSRQPWLRRWVEASRQRPGLLTAPAELSGVRQMIRALRAGHAVGLLPDQVPPDGLGVWAPFFGQPAYTMTLAARLIQQTGAPALLIWAERLSGGRGFHLRVRPLPDPVRPEDDAAQSATRINHAMETVIMQCPQQYLWGYNRYKSPRCLPATMAPRPEAR